MLNPTEIPDGSWALHWSSGKDAAFALHLLRAHGIPKPKVLLTTCQVPEARVSMHGLRVELLHQQARLLDIPLRQIDLPAMPNNATYANLMANHYQKLKAMGIDNLVFGDIFLEDLRKFREKQLAPFALKAIFPLWKQNTQKLASAILDEGFQTTLVCIRADLVHTECLGKDLSQLLPQLPKAVDPCGENGEFHSFVRWMPGFSKPISVVLGNRVVKQFPNPNGHGIPLEMHYLDLLPS